MTSYGATLFADKINAREAKINTLRYTNLDPPFPTITTPTIEQVLTKGNDAAGKDLNNVQYLRTTNAVFAQNGTIEGNAVAKCVCTDLDLSDASNVFPTKYDQLITDLADLVSRVDAIELAMEGGPK